MAKPFSGFSVTTGITLEIRVVFGPVVVRQFEDTFPVESVLCFLLGREVLVALLRERQEVEGLSG